jgi:hypothetical protein
MKVFTLYIGSPDPVPTVLRILCPHFDSFTLVNAQGVYHGEPEPTLMVYIATDDVEALIAAAQEIRAALHQTGLGICYGGHFHRCRAEDDVRSLRNKLFLEVRESIEIGA